MVCHDLTKTAHHTQTDFQPVSRLLTQEILQIGGDLRISMADYMQEEIGRTPLESRLTISSGRVYANPLASCSLTWLVLSKVVLSLQDHLLTPCFVCIVGSSINKHRLEEKVLYISEYIMSLMQRAYNMKHATL